MVQYKSLHVVRPIHFYRKESGREPVRDWLKRLPHRNRKIIGRDILTLQVGWPVGMPLARKMSDNLWEIRSKLVKANARIIFTVKDGTIVLLHGFIKRSRKTPARDLQLARIRLKKLRRIDT